MEKPKLLIKTHKTFFVLALIHPSNFPRLQSHKQFCSSNTFSSICPGRLPTWDKLPCWLAKEHTSCTRQWKHCVLDAVLGHLALLDTPRRPYVVPSQCWPWCSRCGFLSKASPRLCGHRPWVAQAQISLSTFLTFYFILEYSRLTML